MTIVKGGILMLDLKIVLSNNLQLSLEIPLEIVQNIDRITRF